MEGVTWQAGRGVGPVCEQGAAVECKERVEAVPCDEGLEVRAPCDGSEGDPQESPQVHRRSVPGLGDDCASWCGNG